MELIYVDKMKGKFQNSVIATIGMFDGVHLGHVHVLKKLKEEAESLGLPSAVITFKEHPDYILKKRSNQGYLTTFKEKIERIEKYNIDYCFVFDFCEKFSKIPYYEFEKIITDKLNVKVMVVGKDTKYGYLGSGNIDTLKKVLKVMVVEDLVIDGENIHSSLIRNLLSEGKLKEASRLLGRNIVIKGIVSKGSQIGQKMNLRTANVELFGNYDYLKKGVYGVKCYIDGKTYFGIANIGNNPSFNYVESVRLEVNLFDFSLDIYGKTILTELIVFVRSEMVFDSQNDLIDQVKKDITIVKEYIKI